MKKEYVFGRVESRDFGACIYSQKKKKKKEKEVGKGLGRSWLSWNHGGKGRQKTQATWAEVNALTGEFERHPTLGFVCWSRLLWTVFFSTIYVRGILVNSHLLMFPSYTGFPGPQTFMGLG